MSPATGRTRPSAAFSTSPRGRRRCVQPELSGRHPAHPGLCAPDAGPQRLLHPEHLQHERLHPLTKIPAYSGAKAAVTNLTQWLAVHFSRQGIRVSAIAPGFFAAGQNQQLLYNPDGTPTARTGKILAATPMGRFGDSRELEGALLFLVNDAAASFITGVTLPVDGGFSAYSGV